MKTLNVKTKPNETHEELAARAEKKGTNPA